MAKKAPRSDNEIVRDIVTTIDVADKARRSEVTQDVIQMIDVLRRLAGPLWGNRQQTLEFAGILSRRLEKLEQTLRAVPEATGLSIALGLFSRSGLDDDGDKIEEVFDDAAARMETFIESLATYRARCARLRAEAPGEHGNSGYRQSRAAIGARELMERWGKRASSSAETSPYRLIAGLLYEAMSGEIGRDLERACDAALRTPIRTEKAKKI